ncbi:cytochrome P450 [Tricladium varicosporioides]|nr:cytochrome P450 [Hymenoscyphus varicosporioides]
MDSFKNTLDASALLGKQGIASSWTTTAVVVIIVGFVLYQQARQTQVPRIAFLPEAPGGLPFIGHLAPLGGRENENDCTVFKRWSKAVSSPVFQIRLGNQRTVIANTFQSIKDLWVGHSNDLISKPEQHGFNEYLELDLSGAAWNEPIKRCRKAAIRALGKPAWVGYYPLLEPSSVTLTDNILRMGENGKKSLEIYPFLRQIVFDLALSLTYGARQKDANDEFTMRLVKNINIISQYRASTVRYKDYVPILRFLIPDRARQKDLNVLYASLKQRIAGLVKDNLSEAEQHGTCKALLQAAPDSTASSVYLGISWLCSSVGRPFQNDLYQAILHAYNGDKERAWAMAFREETVPLVVSFYKELLRFFTTTPFATPRMTVTDIEYQGATIPAGTAMIMNAQEANHDKAWFGDDADRFNPRRFLKNDVSLPHLTFGAGSRICPAAALSNRIIYALLIKMVLAFEMDEATDPGARRPNIDILDFSDVKNQLVALPRSFDCKFTARDQAWLENKLMEER